MTEAVITVPVYRGTRCGHIHIEPVHPESLFGYCRRCRLHMTMTVATDPEALRYSRQPDPFYPTGTDW